MKQLFETITQAEMLGFAFLVIAAMVIGVAIIFFFVLIITMDKKHIPVLRPVREPEVLRKNILDIKSNFAAHANNIMSLDEGKDLKREFAHYDVAMLILKNYGNCSALDIQITNIGEYCVLEDFSSKYSSLQPGDSAPFLIYIPKDLLNSVKVSAVKVKYRNFSNSTKTDKFSIIAYSDLAYQINDKHTLYAFIQI